MELLTRLVAWGRRWLRRLLGLAIAGTAAIWSFDTLNNLAQHIGFGHLSWMLPICIDAAAALGMDYWMTRSPAWRFGRNLALTMIVVSVGGNIADWVLRQAHPLAVILGMIPPAVLAAVLGIMHRNAAGTIALRTKAHQAIVDAAHEEALAELARADREARRSARHAQTRPAQPEQRNVTELSRKPDPAQLPASDRERLGVLEQFAITRQRPPTKRETMELLRVGSATALRLTRTVRKTVTTETVETEDTA